MSTDNDKDGDIEFAYNRGRNDGPITDNEALPDKCCTRFCSEWRYPGWFGIQEGSKVLDIPNSFGPTTWTARIWKFLSMAWIVQVLIQSLVDTDYADFWFAYLTNVTLLFTTIWSVVTFVNSLRPPSQPLRTSDSVCWSTKLSWLLFELVALANLVVVLLFWTVEFQYDSMPKYVTVMTHAGTFLLVWIEGLFVSRIPVRLKHLPIPMLYASLYVLWTVIHQMATDIGNPNTSDQDPTTNDDVIYQVLNYQDAPTMSAILVCIIVLVVIPLAHWILWLLSLYSFPCGCSGQNRRYLSSYPKASAPTTANDDTTNTNVYEKP